MNLQQVQEALETSIRIAHQRIDENAQLEMDLIDVKCEKLLAWNQEVYETQVENLYYSRANTLIDKLKISQYKYNIQMYRLQLKEQKSVHSQNGTEK